MDRLKSLYEEYCDQLFSEAKVVDWQEAKTQDVQ